MRTRNAFAVAVVTASCAAAACSLLVPLDDQQCATDGDCAARGVAFAGAACVNSVCVASTSAQDASPDVTTSDAGDAGPTPDASDAAEELDPWRCLAQPPQVVNPDASIDLQIDTIDALKTIVTNGPNGGSDLDLLSGTPISGVIVRPCSVLDVQCKSPVFDAGTSDDAGKVHFTLPGDFDGYFEFSSADGALFPSTVFPGRLLADGGAKQELPTPLLSVSGTDQLASALGVPMAKDPDGGLGHAFFEMFNCDDRHAPGVVFALGDGGLPDGAAFFYTQGGFPLPSATQTDYLGTGGVVNYGTGFVTVTATEVATGRVLVKTTTSIRAGAMTFALFRVRTR